MARIVVLLLLMTALEQEALDAHQKQQTAESVNHYYISPGGSDQNRGTLKKPWRTVAHALQQVGPGDVINLRGGTYYEHELVVEAAGTASAPITIQSYPGERAVIDGGVPFFQTVPNSEWQLVDDELQLYRSRRTFPDDYDFVRAWLVDDDVQLVEYESAANLESTNYGPLNGMEPFYMGPGVQLRADGHLYIRLVYNPNDLTDASGNPIPPTPRETNPNRNRIAVAFSKYLFRLDGASHLRIKNLDLVHSRYIFDVRNGSHHVLLSGCRVSFSNYGIVIREESHAWEITGCEFTNGAPDYIYWTDVKNRVGDVVEAYPEFQSAAISGVLVDSHIHHNLFRDTFDGLDVERGSRDTRITDNIFKQVRDDAINLARGIGNVEVSHNLLWHVMGGIANLSSGGRPGPVYIHHNVIDNSAYQRGGRPGNYREDNWPVWTIGSPFPGHDDGKKASWWKVYNNTIITRQDDGHRWSPAGPDEVSGNPEKAVLNNIFYIIGERVVFRGDSVSAGSHYDGNVFYRREAESLPLFLDFGDGGEYDSLHEFRVSSGTDWERHGLEIDPGFDLSALADTRFNPAVIWERYRPTNPQVMTPGAPYDGLDWPGTQGVNYRGALPGAPGPGDFLPVAQSRLHSSAGLFPVNNTAKWRHLTEGLRLCQMN